MKRIFFILSLFICIYSHSQNRQALLKSDSLFAKGTELYNQGNYKAAIPLFTESDKIDKAELDSTSNRRDYSAMWLGSCYYKLGDEENAKASSAFDYMYNPIDRKKTIQSDSLHQIGHNFMQENKPEQALKFYKQTATIEKQNLGPNNLWYANTLEQITRIFIEIDDSIQALKYAKECYDIHNQTTPLPTFHKITTLLTIASIYDYYKFQNHDSIALTYYDKALEIGKELKVDTANMQYLMYYNAKALKKMATQNYNQSTKIKHLQRALQLLPPINGNNEIKDLQEGIIYDYTHALEDLALTYSKEEKYDKSLKIIGVIDSLYQFYEVPNEEKARNYYYTGYYNYLKADTVKALASIPPMDSLIALYPASNKCERVRITYYKASLYANINATIAITLLEKCDSIYQEKDHWQKWIQNKLLSLYKQEDLFYKEGILSLKANKTAKETLREKYNEAVNLTKTGQLSRGRNSIEYVFEKNTGDSIDYELKGLSFILLQRLNMNNRRVQEKYCEDFSIMLCKEKQTLNSRLDSVTYLSNLSYYICDGIPTAEKGKLAIKEAIKFDRLLRTDTTALSSTMIDLLELRATAYIYEGNWRDALKTYAYILNYHPGISLGLKNYGICRLMLKYAWAAINLKKIDETLYNAVAAIAVDFINKDRSLQADLTREAVNIWAALSFLYSPKETMAATKVMLTILRLQIMKKFEYFTNWERDSFFKQHESDIQIANSNLLKLDSISNKDKALFMTNNIFFSGMLLRNENNLRRFISMNQNDSLKKTTLQWKQIQEEFTISKSEEKSNEIFEIEEKIMKQAQELGYKSFDDGIPFDEFTQTMTQEDVLIQFGIANNSVLDETPTYMAYILHKNGNIDIVSLFEEEEFMQHKINSQTIERILRNRGNTYQIYDSPDIGKLIWRKILPYCLNTKRIYFAPIGLLHKIGIESLLIGTKERISDKYQVYRLSSLRAFCRRELKNNDNYTASIFGGLIYEKSNGYQVSTHSVDKQQNELNRSLAANISRSNINPTYLPGTKKEVEEIDKVLKTGRIQTQLFIKENGTEEAFKALSGKGRRIIHIATHGYYIPEQQSISSPLDSLLKQNNTIDPNQSILRRSGLLLSGCNLSLQGAMPNSQLEDGILTTDEISQMNLKGTDIIVLSACETGLGEITGEGVFGLQRGFKKAEANSLLMSLWKVDDNATRLLMTEFYKNLLAGKSKFESLRKAQEYVRDYEEDIEIAPDKRWESQIRQKVNKNKEPPPKIEKIKRYISPYYWAAFILLDAID